MHRDLCRGLFLFCLFLGGVAPAVATDPAIATVADDLTGNGNCTLREAVAAAVTDAAFDACPAGSAVGADTIVLGAGIYLLPLGVSMPPVAPTSPCAGRRPVRRRRCSRAARPIASSISRGAAT